VMEGVTRRRCDLVVSGDDDDTDAGTAAFLDGVNDLLARWIQHADDSDERAVRLRTYNTSIVHLRQLLQRRARHVAAVSRPNSTGTSSS